MKKVFIAVLSFLLLITSSIYSVNAKESISIEDGIEVGSIIYQYDENGNMKESIVDLENAISIDKINNLDIDLQSTSSYTLIKIMDDGSEILIESFDEYDLALTEYNELILSDSTNNYAIKNGDDYLIIKYAVVVFKKIQATNSSGTTYIKTTNYTNADTGASGYTHVLYGLDAAYLETIDDEVKFKMSGVTGLVDSTLVDIIPYSKNTTFVNCYIVSDGNIYHKIKDNYSSIDSSTYYSILNVGKATDYLKEDITYYSYDGHYFYEDYFKMIDDYRNETNENAINKDNPHYNYYQYLPFHSQTNYTADEINDYIGTRYTSKPTSNVFSELTKTQSLLYGEGESFINGNELAINPLLTLGIAINESGWGRSSIAITKNNLFGLNAIDSSAQNNADTYISVEQCIEVFMQQYITHGYLDTKNDSRYYGGHLGDKESGINVKYASDPYWGEKAATHCYTIDNALGKKDYQYYSLGIKESTTSTNIYKDMNTSSDVIYKMTNAYSNINIKNMPVILIETDSNSNWYKIYTDHLLDENQNRIYRASDQTLSWLYSQVYSFEKSFGYVQSSEIRKVNESILNENPEVSDIFNDVNEGDWYEESVQYVYDNGMMSGNAGNFDPYGEMTRAMVVTTLYRLSGSPEVSDTIALTLFSDVEKDSWYTDAVCWAYNTGVTTGYPDRMQFGSYDAVTRQQLATFLYRYASNEGLDTTVRADFSEMAGADQVDDYATEAMQWAVGIGLISGKEVYEGDTVIYDLAAQESANRAQMATILMRFCEYYGI